MYGINHQYLFTHTVSLWNTDQYDADIAHIWTYELTQTVTYGLCRGRVEHGEGRGIGPRTGLSATLTDGLAGGLVSDGGQDFLRGHALLCVIGYLWLGMK